MKSKYKRIEHGNWYDIANDVEGWYMFASEPYYKFYKLGDFIICSKLNEAKRYLILDHKTRGITNMHYSRKEFKELFAIYSAKRNTKLGELY